MKGACQRKKQMDGNCRAVLLFDSRCNLCTAMVQFILAHDRHARLQFCALGTESASRYLATIGLPADYSGSVVLVAPGRASLKSTAALRVLRLLGFPWSLFYALILIPRYLRDQVYGFAAVRRNRLCGMRTEPLGPPPGLEDRFIPPGGTLPGPG